MTEDPRVTLHEECIVCRTCENTCPENAISFDRVRSKQVFEKQQFLSPGVNLYTRACLGLPQPQSVSPD